MNFIAIDIPDPLERAVHLADLDKDICDPCRRGAHDGCRAAIRGGGSCADCGERFHSDPDDRFFLDRGITEDWTTLPEAVAAKVDGNRGD